MMHSRHMHVLSVLKLCMDLRGKSLSIDYFLTVSLEEIAVIERHMSGTQQSGICAFYGELEISHNAFRQDFGW